MRPDPSDDRRWKALVNRALPADDSRRKRDAPRGVPGTAASPDGEAFEHFCRIALRTARWRFAAAMVATAALTALALGVLVALLSGEGRPGLPGTGPATAAHELRETHGASTASSGSSRPHPHESA